MTKTTIVLLPGLDGTGTLFGPLIEHLPPELRPLIVAYPTNEKLGYAALLEKVLRSLPPAGPFIILGESFSGPLALMAAATGPPRLQVVILCATFVRNPFWIRAAWLRHLVPAWAFRLYPYYSMSRTLLGRSSTPELRAACEKAIGSVRPEVLAHRVREAIQVNVSQQLSRCPVPVLYLRASYDVVIPRHNSREIARLSPRIVQATIATSHLLLQTRPREAAAAICRFIESTVPPN